MSRENKTRERFEKIKKKYGLPDYENLDKEFEIYDISPKAKYFLREIRRTIVNKFKHICKLIEKTIYTPDSSLIDLCESSLFSRQEIQRIFDIFRKLALLIRESDLLEVKGSEEKEDAEWIKKAYNVWNSIKNDIENFILKKKEYWKKERKFKYPKEYVG